MKKLENSPKLLHRRHNHSLRLKKKRDEVKQEFVKSRMSGEYGYHHSNAAVDTIENIDDDKLATLDAGPTGAGLQQKLRPLLRSRYRQDMMITEYGLVDKNYTEDDNISTTNCFSVSRQVEVTIDIFLNTWSINIPERGISTSLPPILHTFLSPLPGRLFPGERSDVAAEGEDILKVEGKVLQSYSGLSAVFQERQHS